VTYLEALADDIRNAVSRNAVPSGDTTDLFVIYAVLLLAKGEKVSSEDVHNAWVAWEIGRGEHHESMVPFAELPAATQVEDSPFVAAIRHVARIANRNKRP